MAAEGQEAKVRDYGLLASAAARPGSGGFGCDAYPDLFEKAAALLHSLGSNHALIDGNKRTAWNSTVVFLGANGHVQIEPADEDAIISLVLAAAQSLIEVGEIADRLRTLFW